MMRQRESAAVAIKRHLVSEPRSRKKAESRTGRHPKHEPEPLSYSSSWLGAARAPRARRCARRSQVVSGLLSASYRSIFIPFWLHGNHHGHRASRLDSAQYAALHHQSAAHRMCALLPTSSFRRPSARLGQRGRVAADRVAGVRAAGHRALRGRHAGPAVLRLEPRRAGGGGRRDEPAAHDAALLWRSRASRRCGPRCSRTTSASRRGASRRGPSASGCCCRSRRTRTRASRCARACRSTPPCSTAAPSAGASSTRCRTTRARTWPSTSSGCRRACSRSTAPRAGAHALRQALVGGAAHGRGARGVRRAARARAARAGGVAAAAAGPAARDHRRDHVHQARRGKREARVARRRLRDSSSEVAKFRRDLKSCFEQSQQATSCGDVPLVCVPILGRAIRVFGSWYALCSMCGALARVTPASRFRDEICCLRCDFAMLAGKDAASEMRARLAQAARASVPLLRQGGARERRGHEVALRPRRPRTRAGATPACRLRCATCGALHCSFFKPRTVAAHTHH